LKSTPLEIGTAEIFPHGKIWPPKIAGKIRFSPIKQRRSVAPAPFSQLADLLTRAQRGQLANLLTC
jgi:hypothetical protein